MKRTAIPLLVAGVLVAFMAAGLTLKPRDVPSPLIGKPAPRFTLPVLEQPGQTLSVEDMRGKVWLLNVWASWCVACRLEHPLVLDAARNGQVPIYGLNYKDVPADAQRWLERFGNPYTASLSDREGQVGIDFGVYGVPETFVIDKTGVIRHKITGPLTPETLRDTVMPLVRKLDG
ncbi:DsbE family thiol:disulfide interchange protein [Variovorax sp. KK3]|uniref:DsbE family thiol:disulfide interchange protein n=1 Tax=Variovorax sp. KK3 TaxID=1855728 RepID=UPI00097BDA91|nr:DsbE family thiol:disulfide interchange protein [Variovorax sp. KK3]